MMDTATLLQRHCGRLRDDDDESFYKATQRATLTPRDSKESLGTAGTDSAVNNTVHHYTISPSHTFTGTPLTAVMVHIYIYTQ